MKSAYELAMERLEKEAPTVKLTEEQKAEIAEVESVAKARVAQEELFLKGEIAKAQAKGDAGAIESLERQLANELRKIQEECEVKKEKIRKG